MKTCKVCGHNKTGLDFYGGDSTCKECRKEKARAYRRDNIDRVKEYDRNRPNYDERIIQNRANYRKRISTPEGRAHEWALKKESQERNLIKRSAHVIAGNALKYGRIVKEPCVICGEEKTEGHHEDYTAPLAITWLCNKHHMERHREINEDIRNGADWSDRGWPKK